MLHEPVLDLEVDYASKKKTKLGIILFIAYAVVFAVFVVIGLNYTHLMGIRVIAGLNLAIVYGMGLILLAGVMGFIYSWICTVMEEKMKKEAGK